MDAGKLKTLEAEAKHPAGIAARIESQDLARLLEERAELKAALAHLMRYDFGNSEGAKEARAALAKADAS